MPPSAALRALGLFGAAACLAPAVPPGGQSVIAEKSFYVTDDVVETMEVIGDSVYVGGHFTHVGP